MATELRIYTSANYIAVTVGGIGAGANRETTGRTWPAVVAAMHPDDRAALDTFCGAIRENIKLHQESGGAGGGNGKRGRL